MITLGIILVLLIVFRKLIPWIILLVIPVLIGLSFAYHIFIAHGSMVLNDGVIISLALFAVIWKVTLWLTVGSTLLSALKHRR